MATRTGDLASNSAGCGSEDPSSGSGSGSGKVTDGSVDGSPLPNRRSSPFSSGHTPLPSDGPGEPSAHHQASGPHRRGNGRGRLKDRSCAGDGHSDEELDLVKHRTNLRPVAQGMRVLDNLGGGGSEDVDVDGGGAEIINNDDRSLQAQRNSNSRGAQEEEDDALAVSVSVGAEIM